MLELRKEGATCVAEEDGRLIAKIDGGGNGTEFIEGKNFNVYRTHGWLKDSYTLQADGGVILTPKTIGGGVLSLICSGEPSW